MKSLLKLFLGILMTVCVINLYAADEGQLAVIEHDIQDAVITTKITAQHTKNKRLNPFKISVSTDDGVVTLSGYVKDKQAFVDAMRIAKTTHGVKSVEAEDLEIKKVNMALTDAYITAKVEATVLKAKVLDDESIPLVGINATTDNGSVTLTGSLKSEQSINYIIKRVSKIKGVRKVVSHLTVETDNA